MNEDPFLVKNLMSTDIVALDPEASVGDALASLEHNGVSELPVMNNSTLRGWVSYENILRRPGINRSARVTTVMESPPRIAKTADIVTAAEMMIQDNVRSLPVVDEKGKLVGILRRTDLLEAAAQMPSLAELPLERVMRRELETVVESTNVDQAAHRLREAHINQLLVLDERGGLLGYVAADDIVQAASAEHNSPHEGRGGVAVLSGRGRARPYNVELKSLIKEAPKLPGKATVADAVALMKREGTTFVAVIEDGLAAGVVSRSNIVERIASLKPTKTAVCQVTGLQKVVDPGDLKQIYTMAQSTLTKLQQELDVEFLNLHYKVYKSKTEHEGDEKFSLTAHLSAGGRFFVQKNDDWNLLKVTNTVLDQLQRKFRELKDLRLEKRKGPPRRMADFYTASPEY